ncbi:MAG: hypothetical protein CSA01_00060 [Bacteroidetes bacterium]|nr:MAG: hypothetical protein CSA01_00060 [Bacteroidota bacterium]
MKNSPFSDKKDFSDILIDLSPLHEAFNKQKRFLKTDLNVNRLKIGSLRLDIHKRGQVYLASQKTVFEKDIITRYNSIIENIVLDITIQGDGNYYFHAGDFKKHRSNSSNLLFVNDYTEHKDFYAKDRWLESKRLYFPISYFKTIVTQYPEIFGKTYDKYKKEGTFHLFDEYTNTPPEVYSILSQIENSKIMGNCSTVYTDAKVLELLSLFFHSQNVCYTYQQKKTIILQKDKDKIHEAAFILLSDLHHPPSIRDLSIKAGINEKKLKKGFKELFDTTVYGYLFEHKMTLAKRLLLETNRTITEIATDCGYDYTSHLPLD